MKKETQAKVKLLTITEASRVVEGLTTYRIRQLCQSGELPCFKSGNKYLIQEDFLLDFIGTAFSNKPVPKAPQPEPQKPEPEPEVPEPLPDSQSGEESMICPYCEFVHEEMECDLWELPEEGEYRCQECGEAMTYTKSYIATYHSDPIPKRTGGRKCKMK